MRIETDKTVIRLDFSFAAAVALMLVLCDADTVLICIFSSLFHECGHLLMMLMLSELPKSVVFGAFGIRIERREGSLVSYRKEAVIALGGFFGNFVLMVCGALFYLFCASQWSLRLVAANGFIACFNLLPVRQLDMGRCLECAVCLSQNESKSEKMLDALSFVTLLLLSAGCLAYNIFIGVNISFIAVTIYLILISGLKEFKNDK